MKKKNTSVKDKTVHNPEEIRKKIQSHEKDTGSTAMQIYNLYQRVEAMNMHISKHKKDNAVKLTLVKTVEQIKKLCKYLKKKVSSEEYKAIVIDSIGLRK
jgi:small subunit ribosomal protein S15